MPYPAFPTVGLGLSGPVAPGSGWAAEPRVLTAGFGGGYAQRTGDGINSGGRSFSLRTPLLLSDKIRTLDDFLTERGGKLPFTFLVPYETVARQFVCSKWNADYTNRIKTTLTATFVEDFTP